MLVSTSSRMFVCLKIIFCSAYVTAIINLNCILMLNKIGIKYYDYCNLNIVGCIINKITIVYFSIFCNGSPKIIRNNLKKICNLFYNLFKVLLGKVIAIRRGKYK